MAEAFQKRRDEVNDSAQSVVAAIEHNESFDGSAKDPGTELVAKILDAALKQFDPRYGGFGSQPKFPHTGAVDLLIDEAARDQENRGEESGSGVRSHALRPLSPWRRWLRVESTTIWLAGFTVIRWMSGGGAAL